MGADTILFAIQSAIKLSQAARQAYVDSTAAAALALPLPDFNSSVTFQTAINYFSTLPAATLPAGVAALIQKNTTTTGLTEPDKALLVQVYLEQRLIDDAAKKMAPKFHQRRCHRSGRVRVPGVGQPAGMAGHTRRQTQLPCR